MPTEIYIAVLAACISVVAVTILLFVAAFYVGTRLKRLEEGAKQIQGDVNEMLKDGRGIVAEMKQVSTHINSTSQDVEQITHTARSWTDRADRMVEAVGDIAEPSVYNVAKKVTTAQTFISGFLQALLSPNR